MLQRFAEEEEQRGRKAEEIKCPTNRKNSNSPSVSLVDNAFSPGLEKIKEKMKDLGGPEDEKCPGAAIL